MKRSILALCALLVLASVSLAGVSVHSTRFSRAAGGSTGDSVTAIDTSAAITIPDDITGLWVVGVSDSTCRFRVQVSPNGTNWYTLAYDSTTAATSVYATSDYTNLYAGWRIRVVQDPIPAPAAADFGRATVFWTK